MPEYSDPTHPVVSIVTIVFNDVLNIEKTILSVIDQTYDNIEYIIVDGGSTDGTVDVIRKYTDRINKWQSESDKGIYDAMNKGLMQASGKWVNFMNAGDYFSDKHVVENFISAVSKKKKHKIVYGNFIWKNGPIENFVIAKGTQQMHYTMPSSHQAFFMDTELHKKNPYDTNYKIAADFDFLCRMKSKKIPFLKIPVTIAVYQGGGLSESMEDIKAIEFYEIFRKYNKYPKNLWYEHIASARIFEAGWRAYYTINFIKRITGEENYKKITEKIKKLKQRS